MFFPKVVCCLAVRKTLKVDADRSFVSGVLTEGDGFGLSVKNWVPIRSIPTELRVAPSLTVEPS